MADDFATPEEVAAAVGITPQVIRYHARRGRFVGARRIGRGYRASWLIPRRYTDPAIYREAIGPRRGPGAGEPE